MLLVVTKRLQIGITYRSALAYTARANDTRARWPPLSYERGRRVESLRFQGGRLKAHRYTY